MLERWRNDSPIWLSSVVLEELYAGAGPSGYRIIEKLERDFERARRVLVPNLNDWTDTGRILSRLAHRFGFELVGRGRLTNDALIATSAARAGIKLLTENQRDFARLAEFCALQWESRTLKNG